MNTPAMIPATLRGKAAVAEVQDLLTQLVAENETIALLGDAYPDRDTYLETDSSPAYTLKVSELLDVFHRRRDAILLKLENKGIKVAPDPAPTTAGEPA
jgi:hypothetical protein